MFYILSQILLFLILFRFTKSIRQSLLYNYLLSSLLILIGMLSLSVGHHLTFSNYQMYSLGFFFIASIVSIRYVNASVIIRLFIIKVKEYLRGLNYLSRLLLIGIAFILAMTAFLGIKSPPNNHDAMTANLARIIFWTENRSVAFYPTSELPQLNLGPFASYKFLNNFFITHNDYLIHLVQWEAMVLTLVAMSLIAQKLKFNRDQQILTVFLVATLPTGLLQATSAQNDYVVVSYIVLVFYFFLDFFQKGKLSFTQLCWIGLTLGLAILTKATSYIYLIGLGIGVVIKLLSGWKNWRKFIVTVLLFSIIPLLILTINGYQFYANYRTFGYITGSFNEFNFKYTNEKIDLNTLGVNLTRNILLHTSSSSSYWTEQVNLALEKVLKKLNINFNDPSNTWDVRKDFSFRIRENIVDENITGNPLHMGLLLILVIICLWSAIKKRSLFNPGLNIVVLSTLISFFSFCLLLKWQPWHARLHLIYFVLLTPAIVRALQSKNTQKIIVLQSIVCVVLFLEAGNTLFSNNTKNISTGKLFTMSREQAYLISGNAFGYDQLLPLYKVAEADGCKNFNLVLSNNEFEYPLWAFSNFQAYIVHAYVKNQTSQLANIPTTQGKDCFIISQKRKNEEKVMQKLTLSPNQQEFGRYILVE